jgi:6-phosphogluconolactonase
MTGSTANFNGVFMPKSMILSSGDRVMLYVAEALKKEAISTQQMEKNLHVSLPGGRTPQGLFKLLAQDYSHQINWAGIHFWWGDERCVPPVHSDSNYGMVQNLLFSEMEIPESNVHRIRGEAEPEGESDRYKHELTGSRSRNEAGLPVLDWAILGMGEDGHTASLFPQMLPLDFHAVTIVSEHPQTGQKRISLGAGAICAAARVSFLVTGKSKAGVVEDIFKNSSKADSYPIAHISRMCSNAEWVMDNEAASGIL